MRVAQMILGTLAGTITIIAGTLVVAAPSAALASGPLPSKTLNLGGTTTIGVEFTNDNFTGARLTYKRNGDCTATSGDVDSQAPSLPSGGVGINHWNWNDEIQSFTNTANCFTRHWEHTNFGGVNLDYRDDATLDGTLMNNRTSSLQWS